MEHIDQKYMTEYLETLRETIRKYYEEHPEKIDEAPDYVKEES